MSFTKKAVSAALALCLCGTLAVPAFATETEQNNTPRTGTVANQTYDGQHFTEVNETVYAVASVNVRSGPGTHHPRLGTLHYGYSVTRIGIGSAGWSMVLWEDQVAYVYSDYLTETRPKGYTAKIDDTALLYQIAIANGLKRSDYTQDTWLVLQDALVKANEALNGKNQAVADDAERMLSDAITALVKMNYSGLEGVLAEVEDLAKSSGSATELWYELVNTAVVGKDLLTSGDQAAVDVTTEQIRTLLAQIRESQANAGTPNIVIQEVPVEVPPTDAFCNIPMHRIWPVLFFISLALNLALVAVIVIYIRNKKKNQHDDTPLVDYDIFDDTF